MHELAPLRCDIDREMSGITAHARRRADSQRGNTELTPLDECSHVYKKLDSMLRVLEGAPASHASRSDCIR